MEEAQKKQGKLMERLQPFFDKRWKLSRRYMHFINMGA
jgi:hypothetical protein